MSDHSDILYDPKLHTHDSCVAEIISSDLLVLIIGSRLGGKALPSAKALVDLKEAGDELTDKARKLEDKLSITQLEAMRAIELGIPIYTFVQTDVLKDHHVYERNKTNVEIIDKIDFPSIEKKETAKYIFEFINYIRGRSANNSLYSFENVEDIRNCLRGQWAQLFQKLLKERLNNEKARRELRTVSAQIDDLKAALITSIGNDQLKETAKGALQFRRLIDFLTAVLPPTEHGLILSDSDWIDLMTRAGVDHLITHAFNGSSRPEAVMIKYDKKFLRFRGTIRMFQKIVSDWDDFKVLPDATREAVFKALKEASDTRPGMVIRQYDVEWGEYLKERGETGGSIETQPRSDERSLGEILSDALKDDDDDG